MAIFKRVMERAVNKRGYPLLALIAAGIFDVYGAYTIFKGLPGYDTAAQRPVYSHTNTQQTGTKKEAKADKTRPQQLQQAHQSIDAVAETAAEKNIQFSEPFPEYNSRLTNSSWQNIADDTLENDVVDNMTRLLVETYKDRDGKQGERWRKADDPVKLALEDTVGKLTQYMDFFNRYSNASKLPRNLALAVSTAESGGDAGAVSGPGAAGLLQVMKGTAKDLKIAVNNYFDMRLDPKESIRGGTEYLSNLIDKYDGNTAFALAAYNAGPGRIDSILDSLSKEYGIDRSEIKWAMFKGSLSDETKNYVVRVLSRKIIFDMLYEDLDIKWQPLFSETTITYTLGEKETLYSVAGMFKVSPASLIMHNKQLADASKVIPGMVVHVPID